jgi:23S rRNA (cytosine1962-C5)-methyltransferase
MLRQTESATVTISRRGADRARARHAWIYRSDLERDGGARGGSVVRVVDGRGKCLGSAFYSDSSQIALRFVTFRDVEIDRTFWRARLARAIAYRERVVDGATAYRLVHGEGDFLSSLVVDRYGDCLAVQTLSQGTDALKSLWVELLDELLAPAAIVERNDAKVRELEGLPLRSGVLAGTCPDRLVVEEHGVRYVVDLLHGQKTGAFLDQRENRVAARRYARGRALDCFSFHGSFALHLASVCERVTAIDSSADALARARVNADVNDLGDRIELVEANVFDYLHDLDQRGERFQTIVLDPPAFAKRRNALDAAMRGYKEINLRALRLLEPGGVLVTATCSYHVSEELFLGVAASAAADAGRSIRLVEKRMQARDHPVLLSVPETYYLKCLILEAN